MLKGRTSKLKKAFFYSNFFLYEKFYFYKNVNVCFPQAIVIGSQATLYTIEMDILVSISNCPEDLSGLGINDETS